MAERQKVFVASNGEKDGGRNCDTAATSIFSLQRPGIEDDISTFPKTPEKLLKKLRVLLAGCRVVVNESGVLCEMNEDGAFLVYKNLPKNLRGAWMLTIDDVKFMVGHTRSTWVLLYDRAPESLYEDPRFMSVDLKRRDVIVLENGKSMFLSCVTREEIDTLNAIAIQSATRKKMPASTKNIPAIVKESTDTIAPDLEGTIDYDVLRRKLKNVSEFYSTDASFHIARFAEEIKFITTLQDEEGNNHYYIIAGENEHAYWLYVNANASPPKHCISTTCFKYKNDSCVLYEEG